MKLKEIVIIGFVLLFLQNTLAQHDYSYIKTTTIEKADSSTLKAVRYYSDLNDPSISNTLYFIKEVVLDDESAVVSYFLDFQRADAGKIERIWINWNPNASRYESFLDVDHDKLDSATNLEYDIVIQMDSSRTWVEYSFTIENKKTDSVRQIGVSDSTIEAYLDWIRKDITQLDSLFVPVFRINSEDDNFELRTNFNLNSQEMKSLLKSKSNCRLKTPSHIRKNCKRISHDRTSRKAVWQEKEQDPSSQIVHEVNY